jgi:hAT family C-terminal dimerisation region
MESGSDVEVVEGETGGGGRGGGDAEPTQMYMGKEYRVSELLRNLTRSNVAADAGFPLLAKAAAKLLSCHATSCATERNWSLWGNVYVKARCRLALDRAKKLISIRQNSGASVDKESDEEITLKLLAE